MRPMRILSHGERTACPATAFSLLFVRQRAAVFHYSLYTILPIFKRLPKLKARKDLSIFDFSLYIINSELNSAQTMPGALWF